MNPTPIPSQALLILLGALSALSHAAQPYPNRPIRIVVPGSAGSSNDFTARQIAQRLSETWSQQIVVDNRMGAGGVIAHEIVAKASPDGHTLIFSTSAGLSINPLLQKTPYDPFRDLVPISMGSVNPQMLFSNPNLPVRNLSELINLAKQKPGQLNCASAGTGTPNHLGCELLKMGIEFWYSITLAKSKDTDCINLSASRISLILSITTSFSTKLSIASLGSLNQK